MDTDPTHRAPPRPPATPDGTAEPPPPKQHWPWLGYDLLIVLPLLYVLSSGPLLWLYDHGLLPVWLESACEVLYIPLEVAGHLSEWVRTFLKLYFMLWE